MSDEREHPHDVIVRIEEADGLYRGSLIEPDEGVPHFVVSGPPRPYAEVVKELLEALGRHLAARARR